MDSSPSFQLSANIVDIFTRRIFPGTVNVDKGVIRSISEEPGKSYSFYLLPGFIDAHIHIESSMLIPSQFARLAVVHGTVATVSDPHEIANVLGIKGIRYMIENAKKVPFYFYFGAPSCVPATPFETAGAKLNAQEIRELFTQDQLKYLSEMMNYPGVLKRESFVMEKIQVAQEFNLPVDGHAPGLKGAEAEKYAKAGISTDHECFTLEEALDKLRFGMKILIREGSAAKNYEALHPLLSSHPDKVMFCSDDKHPNELVESHINALVKRSLAHGYELFDVIRAACYHPVAHYKLDVGILRINDAADFILVKDLTDFEVIKTYIRGALVAENGKTLISSIKERPINHFETSLKTPEDFKVKANGSRLNVIEAIDGELVTRKLDLKPTLQDGFILSDPTKDILKLAVVNRYANVPPAIGFIKNVGLKKGAIASSIAHDSHNIIVVGVTDDAIADAVNAIINAQGGISIAFGGSTELLSLPIAGLMSAEDGYLVAEQYSRMDALAKQLGTPLKSPFMTLAFMALLVIPALKLSDKGLFDVEGFSFTPLTFT